jgi:hypothetical protein
MRQNRVAAVPLPFSLFSMFGAHRSSSSRAGQAAAGRGSLFHFMSIAPEPHLEVSALQKKYHEMQWRFHPDQQQQQRHQQQLEQLASAGPAASSPENPSAAADSSLDDSVYANIAYETLRDPFLRCKYLLKLTLMGARTGRPLSLQEAEQVHLDDNDESLFKGAMPPIPSSATDGSSPSPAQQQLLSRYEPPADFLMSMMELNEEVFDADPSEPDGAQRLQTLLDGIKARDGEFFLSAKQAWAAQEIQQFKETVLRWTYIANLKKQVTNKLP